MRFLKFSVEIFVGEALETKGPWHYFFAKPQVELGNLVGVISMLAQNLCFNSLKKREKKTFALSI